MRYHLTPVRKLPSINQQKTSVVEDVEKRESYCIIGGDADWCSHCKKQDGDTSKYHTESAFWPSNPTSGNTSKGTQNTNSKGHKHPYVHCSIIYYGQDMEAAQVSINRGVDNTTYGVIAQWNST